MSAINDALKKSSSSRINLKGNAPTKAAEPSEAKTGGGKGFTVFLICFVLAGATALGAWNYWNKKYKNGVTTDANGNVSTNNNPLARAAAVFNKVLDRNKEGEAAAEGMQKGTGDVAAAGGSTIAGVKTNSNTGVSLKAKPRAAWIPGLPRVQAIIYRPEDPIAIIDGKNKRAGDRAGQGLILEVKKDLVLVRLGEDIHEVPVRQ